MKPGIPWVCLETISPGCSCLYLPSFLEIQCFYREQSVTEVENSPSDAAFDPMNMIIRPAHPRTCSRWEINYCVRPSSRTDVCSLFVTSLEVMLTSGTLSSFVVWIVPPWGSVHKVFGFTWRFTAAKHRYLLFCGMFNLDSPHDSPTSPHIQSTPWTLTSGHFKCTVLI